jgi:uncharacterized Zn finger protein
MKCKNCGKEMSQGILRERGYWGVEFVWKRQAGSNLIAFVCDDCGTVSIFLRDKLPKDALE